MAPPTLVTIQKTLSAPGLASLNENSKNRNEKETPLLKHEVKEHFVASPVASNKIPEPRKLVHHELINAVTMIAPSLVTLSYVPFINELDAYGWLVFSHCFVHMPFSVMHHTNMGLGDPNLGQVGWGLIFRRLDYTFIHVACVMLSFGLSRSILFGILCIFINGWFVYKVWTYSVEKSGPHYPPLTGIGLTVSLYIFSMLFNGLYMDFFLGASMMSVCLFLVKTNILGDFSHPAMHIAMALPQFFFLSHASSLKSW